MPIKELVRTWSQVYLFVDNFQSLRSNITGAMADMKISTESFCQGDFEFNPPNCVHPKNTRDHVTLTEAFQVQFTSRHFE